MSLVSDTSTEPQTEESKPVPRPSKKNLDSTPIPDVDEASAPTSSQASSNGNTASNQDGDGASTQDDKPKKPRAKPTKDDKSTQVLDEKKKSKRTAGQQITRAHLEELRNLVKELKIQEKEVFSCKESIREMYDDLEAAIKKHSYAYVVEKLAKRKFEIQEATLKQYMSEIRAEREKNSGA